jgi:hypothetical protein
MLAWARAAVFVVLAPACLAENPPVQDETDSSATKTDSGTIVPAESMLGCPEGQTCAIVLGSVGFDDRGEIFATDARSRRTAERSTST